MIIVMPIYVVYFVPSSIEAAKLQVKEDSQEKFKVTEKDYLNFVSDAVNRESSKKHISNESDLPKVTITYTKMNQINS